MTFHFWPKVNKTQGCWEWTASKTLGGYGNIWVRQDGGKKLYLAHRLSWIIHNGEIPNKLFVLHRCDNRGCVRPDHLFLGTCRDNANDKTAKERYFTPFKPKFFCKRGHKLIMRPAPTKCRGVIKVCLKCKNISRDLKRRRQGKKERPKRNQ